MLKGDRYKLQLKKIINISGARTRWRPKKTLLEIISKDLNSLKLTKILFHKKSLIITRDPYGQCQIVETLSP